MTDISSYIDVHLSEAIGQLGEYVALKFIRDIKPEVGSDPDVKREQQERVLDLLQEARATLRLRHEHIIGVRDIGRIEQQFYIAMDYIDGRTLADQIRISQKRGRPMKHNLDFRICMDKGIR